MTLAPTTPATSPVVAIGPAHPIAAIADLLHRHHTPSALPGILTTLNPLLAPAPTAGGPNLAEIPVAAVLAIHRLAPRAAAEILEIAAPWLTTPEPPAEAVLAVVAGNVALTQRELQVLRGMARGRSNTLIGRELYLSEDTIKTHARRLFRKLGAKDRAQAVNRGWELGVLGGDR